jgi:virginiamycin B lyase
MLTKKLLHAVACVLAMGMGVRRTAIAAPAVGDQLGYFQEYSLGNPASGPAIVAVDGNDNVWIAVAKAGRLAMFSNGALKTFEMGADSRPVGIAVGSPANGQAGFVWIAASYDNKLIRFDVSTHEKREFKIDGVDSWPFNLAIGKDGGIWFTERASGRVGNLDPATGAIKHFEPPTKGAGPAGLAIEPRSGKVWFSESYADRIGVLDPSSGEIHEIKMGDKSTGLTTGPAGLCIDGDGGVWFSKLDGKLGHIPRGSESIEIKDFPSGVLRPAGITAGANGDIWAGALDGNLLVRYRPSTGEFSTFPIPTGASDPSPATPPNAKSSRPFGIAVDTQGNVWFSEQYTGKLGVLDVAPPVVKVDSPVGPVRTAFPLLSMEVTDRVAGISGVTLKIDDVTVEPRHGHLDLSSVSPGTHRLEVTATDGAGLRTQVNNTFQYEPSPFALVQMLDSLNARNEEGMRSKTMLMGAAREMAKGDSREKLQEIRAELTKNREQFAPFPETPFLATIDYLMTNAARIVEVQIFDNAPFFSAPQIKISTGDTVSWKYAPPSDGHTISSKLHRVEVVGKVRSDLIRSGESFSYRFEDPGEYAVRDERNEQASLVIKVANK